MENNKKIYLKNITFGYNGDNILFKDVSLNLVSKCNNGILAVMGGSGSGKSSFVKLILGLEKQFSGTITTIPSEPVYMYLPQEPILFDHLSPLENAQYFKNTKHFGSKFDTIIFDDLVKELGMEKEINSKKSVSELSGGQKQRLSLIRALSVKPDFLVLDEPTKGLDNFVKNKFLAKLRELVDKYALFVLYITHDREDALQISDEVLYISQTNEDLSLRQLNYGESKKILSELC
jgi:ABC-type multidrug transport system ATPase subunit